MIKEFVQWEKCVKSDDMKYFNTLQYYWKRNILRLQKYKNTINYAKRDFTARPVLPSEPNKQVVFQDCRGSQDLLSKWKSSQISQPDLLR